MNTEEQLTKIHNELEDMIDVQVYSHELRDDLLAAAKAVYKARDTAHRVITMGQPDKYGKTIGSARKSIKSSLEDTSNDYGFYWDGDYIYDKDKRHWYFGDYLNGNTGIEPYSTYMQAVKETEDSVRDAFWEDEIPDPFGYAEALVNFAIETIDDPGRYIKEYEGFVGSSRKPIKSAFGGTAVFEIMDNKLMDARRNIRSCISINPREELNNELQNIDELIGDALTHTEMVKNGDYDNYMSPVNNSRKPIKSDYHDKEIYRQAFGSLLEDYAPEGDFPGGYRVLVDGNYETEFSANSREEAIQKFKDYFANKKEGINNSKKPIKSSLEDRLVPYLEEFEEGYSDALVKDSQNGDDFTHVYEDTFYEMFKSDYNLTDADIQKLEKAVREIWDASSTEEGEVRDMGEMYGAPRGASSEEALKHFE